MRRQILFALPLIAVVSVGLAEKSFGDEHASELRLRPVSVREGRAIVQETAWAENEEGRTPDCSHLVHDLYEQAGYPYPYASSLDLYNGMGQFARVRAPQPGDLIVWRGHVGIVVDPKEHSFFSSVSSGARTEYYDSAYWRARGHARFYRYLTSRPARSRDKALEAANRPPEREPRRQAESSGTENRPTLQAVKTTSAAANKAHVDAAPASTTRADSAYEIPLRTGRRQPRATDVAAALTEANLEASEILRAGNLEQLEQPVAVYRDLQVSGVEIKGKRGETKIQLQTLATLSATRMESQQGWEEHKLELERTKKGWVMTPDTKGVYVPRDAALRILAARLALLTQSAETNTEKEREQAEIIRFMNLLIE